MKSVVILVRDIRHVLRLKEKVLRFNCGVIGDLYITQQVIHRFRPAVFADASRK